VRQTAMIWTVSLVVIAIGAFSSPPTALARGAQAYCVLTGPGYSGLCEPAEEPMELCGSCEYQCPGSSETSDCLCIYEEITDENPWPCNNWGASCPVTIPISECSQDRF
jgi:hypothetical protein